MSRALAGPRRIGALVAVAASLVAAGAAAASPPVASTAPPTEVTEDGATLNGRAYANDGTFDAVTYYFQYGPTKAYGTSTSPKQQPSSSGVDVSERVSLPSGSTFHFRIVVTNAAGETALGRDVEWKTPGLPPPGPGTKRTTETLGAGGSMSTGSNPSKSNPIVVSLKAENGGEITIDEIPDPERPAPDPRANNIENDAPKDRHWYGPAIRIFPPDSPDKSDPEYDPDAAKSQVLTIVFRIDGSTDTVHPDEWRLLLGRTSPQLETDAYCPSVSGHPTSRSLPGGDTQLTFKLKCRASPHTLTFHFNNPGWGVRGGEYFGAYNGSPVAPEGVFFGFHCILECSRTVTASISRKSAKKLGLKSNILAAVHTDRGEKYDPFLPFKAKARKALKRIARKGGGTITISFQAKAVGPDGQVFKKSISPRLKLEKTEEEDL